MSHDVSSPHFTLGLKTLCQNTHCTRPHSHDLWPLAYYDITAKGFGLFYNHNSVTAEHRETLKHLMIYNIKHYHPSGRVLVCMYKSFTITFLRSLPRFICSQYPSAILPVVGHTLPGRLGSLPRFICSQYPSAIQPVVGRTLPGRSSIAWWGAILACLSQTS